MLRKQGGLATASLVLTLPLQWCNSSAPFGRTEFFSSQIA
jgi:hypothetical protein